MADRREQLLDAFKEHEETDEEAGEGAGEGEVSLEADADSDTDIEKRVLESKEETKTDDEESGKEAGKENAKRLEKDGENKSGKSGDNAISRVRPDKNPAKKDNAAQKDLEQQEKLAAEAGEAPKSWRPKNRELWTKLPAEAREEINKREGEITKFISQHGTAIQHKQQFDELVQPFMPFIAAQQSTPFKAFHGLMTTAARLTTGAMHQKAQVISEIIQNYGIDLRVLDEVLAGQQSGRQPNQQQQSYPDSRPPAWAQPMFNFMTEVQQSRQQRAKKVEEDAAREIAEFEKKPFYSDLKDDIGFLMSHAAERGQLMTMEQAYQKARKMNSEVDAILTQREKAAEAKKNGNSVERSQRAASSVRGAPSGSASSGNAAKNNGATDRRSQLMEAYKTLQND